MPITLNNYEVYFVDYHEGLLSPELVAELFLFLEKHPELKEQFESFSEVSLDAGEEAFPIKDQLKRGSVNPSNLSWFLIAEMEGDLKINESAELKKYLQNHPDHYHDRELFSKTRLEATNEVFQDKKSLKQPVPFFVVHRTLVRYAAAALLLLSLIGGSAYLINRSMFSNEERMAQQQNVKSVIKPAIQNAPVKDVPPANVAHDENASVEKSSLANVSTPVNQNASQEKLPVEEIKESINQHELTESSSEKHIEPIASITGTGIPTNLDQSPDKTRSHQPVSSQPAASSDEQYMTVWEALRKASNKEMMKLAGQPQNDEPLAYAEQQSPGLAEIVGSGIGKLTNEKITYSEQNDEEGKKSGFRFAIGGFAIEK